ncbi:MAG: MarP family serine protease [Thermoleophilia bacterium]|nr:MarP family serine protease [Thermoleophilia bacterium]
MSSADVVLVAWLAIAAFSGYLRGFTAQLLSLAGVLVGLVVGALAAPHLLPRDQSEWIPLASFAGAATGALALGLASGRLSAGASGFLSARPALRAADRAGGALAGAVLGLALASLTAVLLLHQPSLGLRGAVQESRLLPALVRAVPLDPLLRALARFDPLPILPYLAPSALPPPDASVLRSASARAAASVVKVEGTSCGLGIQGSGWVAAEGLVATNAHVVSGQNDTRVLVPDGTELEATVVYLDGTNDVALLHVPGLRSSPLASDRAGRYPRPVVLLGYPRDGALVATPATAGAPRTVVASDAYDRRLRARLVVPLRGRVEPGESGGPVVDRHGRVVAMVFGGSRGVRGGFAVPVELVDAGLGRASRPVSSGPCVR